MCRRLGVSAGGFYAWAKRQPSARQIDDMALTARIRQIHVANHAIYGSPRVTETLRQEGMAIGQRRVARLMRNAAIQGRSARLYRRPRVNQKAFYNGIPNRERHIELSRTNQIWVGDVTYLRVRQQWRYMAVVMDKYSRRIVGWSLGQRRDAVLTATALDHALRSRRPGQGLIFHTDRGIEYAAHDYRSALHRNGLIQSMNRPGRMNDNAHMESFFHSMKSEYLYGKNFDSDNDLHATLQKYLQYYNHGRLHSSLGHHPPVTFEQS